MALENSESRQRRFFPKKTFSRAAIVFAGATASVVCYRTGFFVFFFLLPLAFSAFFSEAKTVWAAGILAALLNILVSVWFYLYRNADPALLQWNALYYTAMVVIFTWINAPLGRFWVFTEIPYRMIAGAVLCTLLLIPVFISVLNNNQLRFLAARQLEALGSAVPYSGAEDAAVPVTMEEYIGGIMYVLLRGGILFSCLFFWWINRQFAFLICRLVRRDHANQAGRMIGFRVPFVFIWILSFSLAAVLLGKTGRLEPLEIGGWNMLVLSVTLFLVQGGSVLLYFLARLPPIPRIVINVGILFLFFRPGINMAVLGLLVLLGIVENWVPFRNPKQ